MIFWLLVGFAVLAVIGWVIVGSIVEEYKHPWVGPGPGETEDWQVK